MNEADHPIEATESPPTRPLPRASWREVKRWSALLGHGFASMFDLLMLITGAGFIGLAATVLIDGFGVRQLALTDNAGSMFGSALLLAVFGSFALGVANEGPIGHGRFAARLDAIEVTTVRAIAIIVMSLAMIWVSGLIPQFVTQLPYPFELAASVTEQVGRAGLFFALLIGLPATFALRYFYRARPLSEDWELPLIFVMWLLGALILLSGAL